MIIVSEGADNR